MTAGLKPLDRLRPRADTLKALAEALGILTEDLYAAAGWKVPDELPSFKPYLRTKYGHLDEDQLARLEAIFHEISDEHSSEQEANQHKTTKPNDT